MPFDAIAMTATADEVQNLVGSRIQKIIQPAPLAVALSLYGGGSQRWLLLSSDARLARVQLAGGPLAKAFPTPGPFVMLLRKYLDGARLSAVEHPDWERVLALQVADRGVTLVAEVMGKHSNVILHDGTNVLGALKMVPPRESRVRPILPGRPYRAPPSRGRDTAIFSDGPRIDPLTDPDAFLGALSAAAPGTTVEAALLGLLPGCSPFLAGQISLRSEVPPRSSVHEVPPSALLRAAQSLYALWGRHDWSPTSFDGSRGRRDFAPYIPVGVTAIRPAPNMSAAIEECLAGEEARDSLASARAGIVSEVNRQLAAARRRVASLREGLEAAANADDAMLRGQMILAYQHAVEPGANLLDIPELDMSIPLESSLSPAENAERAFRRYRKLRDAGKRVPALLEEAERDVARLEDIGAFVRLATKEGDLRDLDRELRPPAAEGKARKERRRGPMHLVRDGTAAIVGRSARENEEVTFKLASRQDLWLHVRERTGAHVILRTAAPPGDEVIQAAAALAAYYSEGRSDTAVDVDIASVRDVRKIPGGPPGRVTYRNFRTVRVVPSAEGWEESRPG